MRLLLALLLVPSLAAQGRDTTVRDTVPLPPVTITATRHATNVMAVTIRGYGARGAGDRSNAGTSRGIRVLLPRHFVVGVTLTTR